MESIVKTQKIVRDKFKQGCVFIFKKWSAFRLALDNNPRVLTYYNEDKTVLEINEMLQTLYEELFTTINSGSFVGDTLLTELADILFGFMNDYFNIILDDQSDSEIANVLVKLYNELKAGNNTEFNKLENYKNDKITYDVEFPILGNQKVIFEERPDASDSEEEWEEEESEKNDNHSHIQNNNKMEEDVDEDGFIEVKKKKKGF